MATHSAYRAVSFCRYNGMSSLDFPLKASNKELVRSSALCATWRAPSLFFLTAYTDMTGKPTDLALGTNLSNLNDLHRSTSSDA